MPGPQKPVPGQWLTRPQNSPSRLPPALLADWCQDGGPQSCHPNQSRLLLSQDQSLQPGISCPKEAEALWEPPHPCPMAPRLLSLPACQPPASPHCLDPAEYLFSCGFQLVNSDPAPIQPREAFLSLSGPHPTGVQTIGHQPPHPNLFQKLLIPVPGLAAIPHFPAQGQLVQHLPQADRLMPPAGPHQRGAVSPEQQGCSLAGLPS